MGTTTRNLTDSSATLSPEKQALPDLQLQKQAAYARGTHLISRRTHGNVAPLSFAQQRLWFLDQLEPERATYNLCDAFRLHGSLQVAALEQSLNEIVRRHEALRTTFATEEGEPIQVITPTLTLHLSVVDLTDRADSAREADPQRIVSEEARQPFDLSGGPLLRAQLIRLGEEEHILILNLHHIVSDVWSLNVLYSELSVLYQAFSNDQPSPLSDLSLQYADYAVWQRERLQGEILDRQLAYWKKQLEDSPAVLNLPTDRPRPAEQTFRGARQTMILPQSLVDDLKKVSRQEGVTLYMTILAAFQVLLYRYTGQDTIVVGSPIAGRQYRETRNLIGFFVNTLSLKTDLSGNPRFTELLARVRRVTLEAYFHQDVPFEKVVEEVHPERNLSHSPLFQVMLAFQNIRQTAIELTGLTVTPLEVGGGTAKFDLTLFLVEYEGTLQATMEYNTDLFDQGTVARVLGHYQTLLEGIVENPDYRLSELPILTNAERHQLLVEWNDTQKDYPRDKCVHELFAAQVEKSPEAVAVVYEEEQLTYRDLNSRANQLAHYLRKLGVGPGVLVGICVERSLEIIVGMLGILKAGGAYVPLDPNYPQERLAFMLADTQAPVVLVQQGLVTSLPQHGTTFVCLDRDWETISQERIENLSSQTTAANLAYVIYTSGSTGQPKGVEVPHRGIVRLVCGTDYAQFDSTQVFLQLAPISFDAATFELWGALLHGARCVLFPGRLPSPTELGAVLHRHQVSTLWLTASLFNSVIDYAPEALTSVRQLLTGGEALSVAHVRRALTLLPATQLINGYGPTESTTFACTYTIPRHIEDTATSIPIGRPIANTEVYVLDSGLSPVPIGVTGELYLSGDGLARGYLDRPELTAERFIPNPFSSGHGAQLYKTGDLVRYLPDGNLEFLGRLDDQVKIRGFRIELGEIEAVLAQHPAVREAVVLAREDSPGDQRLVAYLVSRGLAVSVSEICKFLSTKLPEYMLPSTVVYLEVLPLTPNGKIDRKALPRPDQTRPDLDEQYLAASTPTEASLAEIWAEVLKVERVGVHDNFFALGGHSLKATQVVARVRRELQVELPLRELFANPTIAGLATRIEDSRPHEQGALTRPLVSVSRKENLPLSFAQQRLWFLHQMDPQSAAYNLPEAMRIRGLLDLPALERSLNEIIRRHEALRTTFSLRAGEPVQLIAPLLTLTLPVVDLTDRAEGAREAEAQQLVSEEARRPFDLSRGPLFRALVIRLSAHDHILLLTFHHIVADGWSLGVFYRELSALYHAFIHDEPSPLTELPIQYADYAVWQREWLKGKVLESQLAYWKRQLAGAPPLLQLPWDYPRPAVQSYQGAREVMELSPVLTESLHALSRHEGTTLFMTLLAAFQTLLARYAGQEDIVVGAPITGRTRQEVEGLVGFFVNTLVLRTDLSGTPTFRELLGRVRAVTLAAYEHQELPFEKLVEELQPERSLSSSPLFQVLFNMVNVETATPALAGATTEPFVSAQPEAKFDLTVYVREDNQCLSFEIIYNTALFRQSSMVCLLQQYYHLLEQMVSDPNQSIWAYSLVTPESRSLLPDASMELAESIFLPVTSEFLAWAEKLPTHEAITQEGNFWTYKELSASAQRLARRIVAHGIQPGDTVAVIGPRCFGMIVSMMGTFMSGGVLLAVDRHLPVNRQRLMLETAQAKCLLYVGNWRSEDLWLRAVPGLSIIGVTKKGGKEIATRKLPVLDDVTLPEISPDAPAYIFLTSGTTGIPKAVLGCHKGLSHFLAWQRQRFEVGPGDRCAQLTGLSFDVVLRDVFLPLTSGATLALPDELLEPASERTLLWLDHEDITLLHVVPTLAQCWVGSHNNVKLHRLRWAFFAGEPLTDTLVRKWRDTVPETSEIVNLYGPTETTLVKCFQVIPREPSPGVQPIGRPLPQTQALVLNRSGQLCGIGEVGEIALRSPFRTLGYLNAPEEQAKRFVQNPFHSDPHDLLYLTGDCGRYRTDGTLEILGRLDDQVKIRGVRIEPGEVTAILGQHPHVKVCFVAVRKGRDTAPILVAYVVPFNLTTMVPNDLRSYLAGQLPAAAIPSAFVLLDALPLSPNGKVNRHALPEPEILTPVPTRTFVAPRTETEQALAEIWCQVLKLPEVSICDNFFDLGGHSLIATQIVSRIEYNLDVKLPLRAIFAHPTIESLALHLLDQQAKTTPHDEIKNLLADLASMSNEEVERRLHDLKKRAQDTPEGLLPTSLPVTLSFHCPQAKSELFGKRECNLILLINERFAAESFEKVAGFVREFDPSIHAVVMRDVDSPGVTLPDRPTLTFSPALIRHHPRRPGRVFCGYPLSKSEEYVALAKVNVAVPRWVLLTEDSTPDLSGFDDYVVRKPNYGGRSAAVKIMQRNKIAWKPITTSSAGTSLSTIVQQFVYTGALPISYRVSTLFGRVLSCVKYQASPTHVELPTPADLASVIEQRGFTIIAPGRECHVEPCFDEEIIRLGEQAHTAFPEIPLLGFDIVQEVPSGKLYVLEANAIGYTWSIGQDLVESYGFSTGEQFDGARKAAYILAEKTQQYAE